jgi:hypothetical protein
MIRRKKCWKPTGLARNRTNPAAQQSHGTLSPSIHIFFIPTGGTPCHGRPFLWTSRTRARPWSWLLPPRSLGHIRPHDDPPYSPPPPLLFPSRHHTRELPGRTESSSPSCGYRWTPVSYSRSTIASPPLLLRHQARLVVLHLPVSFEWLEPFTNRRFDHTRSISAAPLTPPVSHHSYRKLSSMLSIPSSVPSSPLRRRRVHRHQGPPECRRRPVPSHRRRGQPFPANSEKP